MCGPSASLTTSMWCLQVARMVISRRGARGVRQASQNKIKIKVNNSRFKRSYSRVGFLTSGLAPYHETPLGSSSFMDVGDCGASRWSSLLVLCRELEGFPMNRGGAVTFIGDGLFMRTRWPRGALSSDPQAPLHLLATPLMTGFHRPSKTNRRSGKLVMLTLDLDI